MKKFFFLCLFSEYFFSFAQWTPQNSGTSNFLTRIFFPSPDTGFVVQDNGIFRKTTNGGTNWSLVPSTPSMFQIYFTSNDTGFATTYNHTIVKSTDGGNTWNSQYTNSNIDMAGIYFVNENIGYAAGVRTSNWDSVFVLRSIDAGNNWNIQNVYYSGFSDPYTSVFFLTPDTGFLVISGFPSLIFMTTDAGMTLDTVYADTLFDIYDIHFPSSDTGYAVGMGGLIIKTIDGGFNWTVMPNSGNTNPLYSVYFTSNDTGYTVGGNGFSSGTILKTTDGGNSWVNEPGIIQTFNSVYFPNSNIGYICGTNGAILKYDATVGIHENENAQASLITYLNPTSGYFILNEGKEGIKDVSVYNTCGQKIFHRENISIANPVIDLSAEPSGIYFLRVRHSNQIFSQKIIINR
jgi:photosystem II stability/assembly factor-like uncharacterized protein